MKTKHRPAASAEGAAPPIDLDTGKYMTMPAENGNLRRNELLTFLQAPVMPLTPEPSLSDIQRMFGLPVTLAAPADIRDSERERLNMAFDHAGGFEQIHTSLAGHLSDLGQFAVTSFVGYSVLDVLAQNPAISRAVTVVANEITKNWIEIVGGEAEDSERVSSLDDYQRNQYKLQALFNAAAKKVGFYGGAIIFIDTGVRGQELQTPLRIARGNAELTEDNPLSFRLIDPVYVTPCAYNSSEPLEADFMAPRAWWVAGDVVHASRLIVITGDEPPTMLKPAYNFMGIPLAQRIADSVAHWNQSRATANNMLEKNSLLVMQTNIDDALAVSGGVSNIDLRMKLLTHFRTNNSVFMCDKESESITNIQSNLSGVTDVVKMNREDFAAAVGVPGVKLFGLSPGGFNATGESDMTSFYDHVKAEQEHYRPALQRCLDAIQVRHFGDIDTTVTFRFAELSKDNAATVATNISSKFTAVSGLVQSNIISPEEARQWIKTDPECSFEFLSDVAPDDPDTGAPDDMDGMAGLSDMAESSDSAAEDMEGDETPKATSWQASLKPYL